MQIICFKIYVFKNFYCCFLMTCLSWTTGQHSWALWVELRDDLQKFNKLKGLQGWQQGRGEDSGPFHGSIYHPWGHEPWHVAHTHEHTHTRTHTHTHTYTHAHTRTHAPWWHPKQPGWGTAVYDRAHTSYSKRLALSLTHTHTRAHTHTHTHTQILKEALQHSAITCLMWLSNYF